MSLIKRFVSFATILTVVLMVAGPAVRPVSALTVEELQAQIAALQEQLAAYQQQLQALMGQQGGTGGTIEGIPSGFTFDRNLKLGMTGDDVKYLQILLNSDPDTKLADEGAGSPGNETTYFGPRTKAAVIKFQEKYAEDILAPWGLTHGTGFVGSTTRAKLNEILAGSVTPPSPTQTCSDYTTEDECTAAGCYWYEEACHEEEQPAPTETGLTVALADDTPAAGYFLDDSSDAVAPAQMLAPFAKFVFTNGDSEDVTVTTLKLKRTGISTDSALSNVYLFDGDTKLAEYTSFTNQIITFTDSSGLFTVPAGGSKEITVKVDVSPALTSSVTSIVLGIESADYIVSDASSVNGDFPIRSNTMGITQVSDLGYVNISSYTTFPATVDPGVTDYELWRFSVQANDQDMAIEKIVMTMVGTIDTDDVQNLKLEVDGTTIAGPVNIGSDNKVVFDMSASPYTLTKGAAKTFILKGDVPTGTGRAFKFTIREAEDFVVKDTQYGVYTSSKVGGAAFSVIDPDSSGDGTNINNGTLTVTLCSDSPSGNVAAGATNVTLAKFCFKANGEDIKVSYLSITVNEESSDSAIDNGKLYYNGSQVGTTDSSVADETANVFNIGNAAIIPAGETGVFEYKADIKSGGNALSAGETIVVSLNAATTYALGMSSLTNISISAVTGRTLTVASGALSAAKNNALADYTESNPLGVKGATEVKVGSFVITAGAGEGVTITQIKLTDSVDDTTVSGRAGVNLTNGTGKTITLDSAAAAIPFVVGETYYVYTGASKTAYFTLTSKSGTTLTGTVSSASTDYIDSGDSVTIDSGPSATDTLADTFQNLKLVNASTGSQIGSTIGTLTDTAGTTYTFNVSPAITLGAGEQLVVDVYADIKTNATTLSVNSDSDGIMYIYSITATGVDTSSDASVTGSDASPYQLHNVYVAGQGSLTVTAVPAPSTPITGQLVMGSSENTFATLSFTAGAAEDVQVTQIIINDNSSFCGSLSNIKLVDASTSEQVGSTIAALDGSCNATFNLTTPWVIPAGSTQYLVVKADVNAYPNAVSGSSHVLRIVDNTKVTSYGVSSGAAITETVSSDATSNTQYVYKTKVTVAKNASSPSGSAVAGAGQEVLRFDVTADSGNLATLSEVALTISGSVDTTGSGNAYLYDASDMTTPLATESYKAVTFADMDGANGGNEYTFQVQDNATACDGIPVGATVRIYDTSASAYLSGTFVISAATGGNLDGEGDTDDCQFTFATPPTTDLDDGDILYYRPLQPGSGKLYFGAHTTLTNDVANGDTTLRVSSLNGFALGDTITVKGYDASGNLLSATGTIKSLSGNTITLDDPGVSLSATIDYDYLSTTANALAKKHTSTAIVYSGSSAYGSVGDIIPAGSTITYVVKGDTTGATTGENLRVDIATDDDLVWSDAYSWTIYDYTQTFPVTGGTLTY